MKWFYLLFLLLLSLAELVFTLLYYYLTGRFDIIPISGFVIYLCSVASLLINYQFEQYEMKRRELLDGLLS